MSDISIPGVNSSYNTDKLIEKMMDVERIPLERMEDTVSTYKDQKQVWQDINRNITQFREQARSLYGFQNPFRERIATSSNESVLTATAARESFEDEKTVFVKQKAKSDRFLSSSMEKGYKISSGTYGFSVGEERVQFTFRGGTLQEFAGAVTENGEGLVKASVVNDTPDTQVLLIESMKTGKANQLTFLDESRNMGIATGILKQSRDKSYRFELTSDTIRPWEKPLSEQMFTVTDTGITVPPGGEFSLPSNRRLAISDNLILQVEVEVRNLEKEEPEAPSPPSGPEVPGAGEITYSDITIENVPSQVDLPEWQPPPPPKRVDDMTVLYVQNSGSPIPVKDLPESGTATIEIPLSEYVDSLSSLMVRNRNTHREIEFKNIRIFDPEARGEYNPAHPIDEASDAVISIDGVEIRRSSNTIDDAISGVTLSVQRASDEPIDLTVEPDRKAVKENIIRFVGYYNRMLTELNILTRNEQDIVDSIEYFSEEEREQAMERLGLFQGDITLNQMKNSLQRIMMDPYETGAGNDIDLMAEIGISTNATRVSAGQGLANTQLRGYLEIDENRLDESLENSFDQVRRLFGYDSDGDLVVDTGVAYTAEQYTGPYVQSGGIITSRIQSIDTRMARTNREIDNYTDYLSRKEQELRREYGQMEGMLENMQQSSEALRNLSRNNNQD
jgi:flagellar hook-associated protein 2